VKHAAPILIPDAGKLERAAYLAAALAATTIVFIGLPAFDVIAQGTQSGMDRIEAPSILPPPRPDQNREERKKERERLKQKPKLQMSSEPLRTVRPTPFLRTSLLLPAGSLQTGLGDIAVRFDLTETESLAPPVAAANVFTIRDLDAPPRLLAPVKPVYPFQAKRKRIEGYAEIEFEIGPDGRVGQVTVMGGEPSGVFDDAAATAAKRWRFTIPTKDGRAVTVTARQRIEFQLE